MSHKRLRIVQITVTVTTALDDGDDLHTEAGQPVSFGTMRAFQEFAAVSLPAQMAAVEAKLNADRANGVSADGVAAAAGG